MSQGRPPLTEEVRVAPTTGAGVVLAIALGALPAALVGLELAWLVVIAALSVLIVAPVLAWREVRAILEVTPPESLRVHAGRATPVVFGIRVRRSCRDLLADISLTGAVNRERDGAPKVAIEGLDPGSPARVPLIVRFTARGTAKDLELRLTSTFPFGLFVAKRTMTLPVAIRVLPRLQPRPGAALESALQTSSPVGRANPRPRPLTRAGLPVGLRAARSGDRLRDIAWKPSVRQARWVAFEREGHETERQITLVLLLGVRGASASSLRRTALAFEAAVSHCATAIDWLYGRTGSVTLEFESAPADGPLRNLARGKGGSLEFHTSRGAGPGALIDRLSEVQTSLPTGEPHSGPEASLTGGPMAGAEPSRDGSDLRVVFIGMSALEYQRAHDAPSEDGAERGQEKRMGIGGRALILGVDANGRVQTLWGGDGRAGRSTGLQR